MCYRVGSDSERKLEKEVQSLEDIILYACYSKRA